MEQELKLAELVTVIETDAPEDSIGIIITKTKEHFDIYVEALAMYAFLKELRQPIRASYEESDDRAVCTWCGSPHERDAPIMHTEDCQWTASRQILDRIEKVD